MKESCEESMIINIEWYQRYDLVFPNGVIAKIAGGALFLVLDERKDGSEIILGPGKLGQPE